MIPSWDINDQRILESDWTRGTTGNTQLKLVVSDPFFLWWLSPSKKNIVSIDSMQIYWWSKNSATCLNDTHNWPNPNRSGSLILPSIAGYLQEKNLWYSLIPSRDIDDQRILQSDWTRDTTGNTQLKLAVSDPFFLWWLSPCKKSIASIDCLQIYWWSKNSAVWLNERHNWPHPTKISSLISFLPLQVISK